MAPQIPLQMLIENQVLQSEATQQFVISCLLESDDFQVFREKVRRGLSQVEVDTTTAITTDAEFLVGKVGYIIRADFYGRRDYLRNDDGLPVVYESLNIAKSSATLLEKLNPEILDLENIPNGK